MIKPTPGRIVHFHQPEYKLPGQSGEPLAAMITCVHSDTLVSLTVYDMHGHSHPVPYVTLVQPEDANKPSEAYCTWMAFQIGQTPAAEALLRRLDDLQARLAALELRLSGEAPALAGPSVASSTPAPPLPPPPI